MPITIRDNAYFYSVLNSQLLQPPGPEYVFDQFLTFKEEVGANQGDIVTFNRYPLLADAGMTEALRTANESNTIGIGNPIAITSQSVSFQLGEFVGPYSTAGTALAPLAVTEKVMDQASQLLLRRRDIHKFGEDIGTGILYDDMVRTHDRFIANRFLASTNFTNPGSKLDAATLVTDKITSADILTIKEKLQTRFTKRFNKTGRFAAVVNSRMEKHIMQDADFKAAAQYSDAMRLFRGYIGTYLGFDFFTSDNYPTATVNSLTAHQGIFFGQGAVGYAYSGMPEIRANKNDDYERFLYLIHRRVAAYATLNTAFIEIARTFAA